MSLGKPVIEIDYPHTLELANMDILLLVNEKILDGKELYICQKYIEVYKFERKF